MTRAMSLELTDGVSVVVPDSLNLLTPYVLFEQRDWFEDEIGFVRRALRPGERAIDIGANYGVYTLTIAKIVGLMGRVWAFEPASSTADLLARGIAANSFTNVTLVRSAISGACGTAQLTINDNSEMNALIHGESSPGLTETVALVTLDDCQQRYQWKEIDFLKIDAEGEETNIINGGRQFLATTSPLILFEVKAGAELHLDLVRKFNDVGFDSYRLIPGLNLLIPFDDASEPDDYLLNLFCCKLDRAALLIDRGLLLDAKTIESAAADKRFQGFYRAHRARFSWESQLAKMPYGAALTGHWASGSSTDERKIVEDALACYAISREPSLPAVDRFSALTASFNLLRSLCGESPKHLRLASLARVARDYGARAVAQNALKQLLSSMTQGNPLDLREPFLAPGARFESVHPESRIGDWILAAGAEEFERLSSFSSFYTGESARPRLDLIASLGFGSEEMKRRLFLVQQRFGARTAQQIPT